MPYVFVDLPITVFILTRIVYFTAVFGLAAILAMYGKPAGSV
jgi:hypothetical protein